MKMSFELILSKRKLCSLNFFRKENLSLWIRTRHTFAVKVNSEVRSRGSNSSSGMETGRKGDKCVCMPRAYGSEKKIRRRHMRRVSEIIPCCKRSDVRRCTTLVWTHINRWTFSHHEMLQNAYRVSGERCTALGKDRWSLPSRYHVRLWDQSKPAPIQHTT